jgi:hypothetical protein
MSKRDLQYAPEMIQSLTEYHIGVFALDLHVSVARPCRLRRVFIFYILFLKKKHLFLRFLNAFVPLTLRHNFFSHTYSYDTLDVTFSILLSTLLSIA